MLSLEQSTSEFTSNDLPKDFISSERIHPQKEVCGVRNSSPHFSYLFHSNNTLCLWLL